MSILIALLLGFFGQISDVHAAYEYLPDESPVVAYLQTEFKDADAELNLNELLEKKWVCSSFSAVAGDVTEKQGIAAFEFSKYGTLILNKGAYGSRFFAPSGKNSLAGPGRDNPTQIVALRRTRAGDLIAETSVTPDALTRNGKSGAPSVFDSKRLALEYLICPKL